MALRGQDSGRSNGAAASVPGPLNNALHSSLMTDAARTNRRRTQESSEGDERSLTENSRQDTESIMLRAALVLSASPTQRRWNFKIRL